MSKAIKIVIGIIVVILAVYAIFAFDVPYRKTIDDFATCAAAGNQVMESFPRQCRDAQGKMYIEPLSHEPLSQTIPASAKIMAETPRPGDTISSPVIVEGLAQGTWFFEATFPIEILGADGTVLGSGAAHAKGDWMTTDFVPFESSISFDSDINKTGIIRLKKDNASGDAIRDENIDVPVIFAASTKK